MFWIELVLYLSEVCVLLHKMHTTSHSLSVFLLFLSFSFIVLYTFTVSHYGSTVKIYIQGVHIQSVPRSHYGATVYTGCAYTECPTIALWCYCIYRVCIYRVSHDSMPLQESDLLKVSLNKLISKILISAAMASVLFIYLLTYLYTLFNDVFPVS
jgi:hypothetical protein